MNTKPLNRKAYTSIGHLPGSKIGTGDHRICDGQAKICFKPRRGDTVIVQEKVDGSCVAVFRPDAGNGLLPINRAGWPCANSPHLQHKYFDAWAQIHHRRFLQVLMPGEWLVGEWCMQAHGTRYEFGRNEPFFAFDIISAWNKDIIKRLLYRELEGRVKGVFNMPPLLHYADEAGIEPLEAYNKTHPAQTARIDACEGVIYRVESELEFNYPAKWVHSDYVPGRYFPPPGGEPVWNWSINDLTDEPRLL